MSTGCSVNMPGAYSPNAMAPSAIPSPVALTPRSLSGGSRMIPVGQFRTNNPFMQRLNSNTYTPIVNTDTDGAGAGTAKPLPGTPAPGTPPLHITPRNGNNRAASGGKENASPSGIRWSPRNQPLKQRNSPSPISRAGSPQPPQQNGQRSRIPSPAANRGNVHNAASKLSPRVQSPTARTTASPPPAQPRKGAVSPKPPRKIPQGPTRRPVPALMPDLHLAPPGSGLLRKLSVGKGNGLRLQPSAPVLRSEHADARAREQLAYVGKGRKRANSTRSAAVGKKYDAGPQLGLGPPATISGGGARQYTSAFSLFSRTARFADPPEAAHPSSPASEAMPPSPYIPTSSEVPQHIRLRLRLLARLAGTLEIDQAEVSRLIDVPGLLARVDKAYERYQGDHLSGRNVGPTLVPMPQQSPSQTCDRGSGPRREWWMFPQADDLLSRDAGLSASASLDLGLESRGMASSFSLSSLGLGLGLGLHTAKDREKEKQGKEDKDKKGVLGKLKMFGRKSLDEARPTSLFETTQKGEAVHSRVWNLPIFGESLVDLPPDGWCTLQIGEQDHELPIPFFILVEEVYRRGMNVPGIFRLAGKEPEVAKQYSICNAPPFYGEGSDLSGVNIHSLANVLKRFMRDLPEPVLDDSLFDALWEWCCAPDFPAASAASTSTLTSMATNGRTLSTPATPGRIGAAVLILKMLPPQHFSLLVYALAFVVQLQHCSGNRLTLDAISIIFGPALLACRSKGVPGLGPGSKGVKQDPEVVSAVVDQSQKALGWLVYNWPEISKTILNPPFPPSARISRAETSPGRPLDPLLLSPIDLRGQDDSPFALTRTMRAGKSLDLDRGSDYMGSLLPYASDYNDRSSSNITRPLRTVASSANISQAYKSDGARVKAPKRSASFTNLASAFKKGIGMSKEPKSSIESALQPSPTLSDYSTILGTPTVPSPGPTSTARIASSPSSPRPSLSLSVNDIPSSPKKTSINPQITNVLGSLQDLLTSKDRQIERDARELALLRHTLLELDEKLKLQVKRDAAALSPVTAPAPSPEIKITASPSIVELNDTLLFDLQAQLSTALSALSQSRETTKQKDRQLVDLHTALARGESTRKIEVSKLEVALAMETARCKGLKEERDLARDRLDKVKKELFSVG